MSELDEEAQKEHAKLNAALVQLMLAIGTMVVGILHIYTDGFVFRHLWNWFFKDPWHMARMTQAMGMGFDLLVSLPLMGCVYKLSKVWDEVREKKQTTLELFLYAVTAHVHSMMLWFIAYVIHKIL